LNKFPACIDLRGDLVRECTGHKWRGQTMALVSENPIFVITSTLAGIQKLGQTPYGERRIINILGGTVEGPKLKGKILPGGADWQIVRADGVVHPRALHHRDRNRRLVPANSRVPSRPTSDGAPCPRRDGRPSLIISAFMRFETADRRVQTASSSRPRQPKTGRCGSKVAASAVIQDRAARSLHLSRRGRPRSRRVRLRTIRSASPQTRAFEREALLP
jgi:hypothetical protein